MTAAPPEAATLAERYRPLIEHDGERARLELAALVQREPGSAEGWRLLALAYLRCMDFAACAEATRRLLALEPADAEGLQTLALCLHGLGDVEGCLAAYRNAFRLTRSTDAAAMIPIMLHRLGRLQEAEKAHDFVLTKAQIESLNVLGSLRGMMNVLRDAGRPLAADGYAHELIQRYRRATLSAAGFFIQRDNAAGFHEWFGLVDKARLGEVLRRGAAQDGEGARVPATFNLPDDREALRGYAAAHPGALYIVKPARGSGGQGITVVPDAADALDRTNVVVQRYVDRPYLVDGRKGHLRIYGLVTSADPLRAYVYREGIVRFAPEPYDPSPERLSETAIHVTNTALHVGHPGLRVSEDPDKDDDGSVWTVSALLRRMAVDGHDPEAVFGRIADLAAWFVRLLKQDGFFARQAAQGSRRAFGPKLFGFDILLDADANPWLIEIQAAPAQVGAPLVGKVNGDLFETLFRMSVGKLVDDEMTPDAVRLLLSDPAHQARREFEIETENRGRFEPLTID